MSKQPNKIDLDFFKTQFEEKSHLDHGWNAPPDFIFDDAIEVVNRRKNRKKYNFLYLISFAIVLTGVILAVAYSTRKVQNLEEQLNILSNKTAEIHSSSTSANTTKPVQELIIKTVEEESLLSTQKQKTIVLNTTKKLSKQTNNENLAPQIPLQQNLISTSLINTSNNTLDIKKDLGLISLEDKEVPELQSLTSLSPNSLLLPKHELNLQPQIKNIIPKKKKLALSFLLNRNASTLKMSNVPKSEQTLTKYDEYYSGIGVQTRLAIPINSRFSISGTVAYNKLHNQSNSNSIANYHKTNEEHMTSGLIMYKTMMNLESPVGTLEHQMAFEVDPLKTREGDQISENTSLDQCLSIINFSVATQYNLITNARFNWGTSLGIGANFVTNLTSELTSEYSMHNTKMGDNSFTMENAKNLNTFYSSVELSSTGELLLGHNFNLVFSVGFSRSLTSLRNNSQGGPNTYLLNWNTSIGVTKTF